MIIMLGTEDTLCFSLVVEEVIKTNLSKKVEQDLLKRLKNYQCPNDDFDSIEKRVRKNLKV